MSRLLYAAVAVVVFGGLAGASAGAHEEVVVEAIVAALDGAQARDGRGMGGVVGRLPGRLLGAGDLAREQVVRVGATFGHVQQACRGKEQVVVHQERPVVHFDEQVLPGVVVKEVA